MEAALTESSAEKYILPEAAPGPAGSPATYFCGFAFSGEIKDWRQEMAQILGWYTKDGLILCDESFFDHVEGDINSGKTCTLTVTCL